MQAANEYIIIEPFSDEAIKSHHSGIVVVDKQKESDLSSGKVISMGDKVKIDDSVKVGSTIFYMSSEIKSKFKLNDKEYYNLNYADILAVEEDHA